MFRIKARVPRTAPAVGLPAAWGATVLTYELACPLAQREGLCARVVSGAVLLAVGAGLLLHTRRTLLRELRRARRVAGAAQSVLLRPPPARVAGVRIAAGQLSADRGARVGGDLYEVAATEHGVRVLIGDVRGHGIGALGTVAAVLGSFREAAHDEPDLGGVLRRLDRALARHLAERAHDEPGEDFVTALLLEIRPDGELSALNCGHPWPFLLGDGRVEPLARADPLPPVGPFPLPGDLVPVRCGAFPPGDVLVLYTDGVEDARDAAGRFFPLHATLTGLASRLPAAPETTLRLLFSALLRHTRGRPADDVALVVLRNDRARVTCGPLGAGVSDAEGSVPGTRPAAT
ncbi:MULTISPECIES: PP2C family protein-serine/threonine phosphatase [unclassified Streptomyces]|uniref:PP2C family protein-serine/threonine phosphatase n=1 Tax=unclassified Streptomyces TaxID=2593676 RepID=UPI00074A91D8|nr:MULTISPECIES: PP2C family protein-serine/threonine phosphatase [unclassified Streptomyces]KUL70912.1 protein phosphatase [Streptomyces sp. NRRL WC-3605]KUL71512.1 protein phosphatase [Streptomyces sp. NRRL WC-3604]